MTTKETTFFYALMTLVLWYPINNHAHALIAAPGADPTQWIWFVQWYAHCTTTWTNPMYTTNLWYPKGMSIAWATSTPLLCAIMTPITLWLGPYLAYNIMATATITANATAGRWLARAAGARRWPATAAGAAIAWSPFALTELMGRPCVYTTWPITCAAAAYILYCRRRRRPIWFIAAATAAMTAQAYISVEPVIAATLTAGCTLAILAITDKTARRRIRQTLPALATAAATTALLSLPMLYIMLTTTHPPGAIFGQNYTSADLLNYIIPTPVNWLGGHLWQCVTVTFKVIFQEQDAYIGIPLLATGAYFYWKHRKTTTAKACAITTIGAATLALGYHLHIAGIQTPIPLPLLPTEHLPILDKLIPVRFTQYTTLAVITGTAAAWPRTNQNTLATNAGTAFLIALSLMPATHPDYWYYHPTTPKFFTTHEYRRYIQPGQNVLTLPETAEGKGAMFTAMDNFYWNNAGGWIGAATQHPYYLQGELTPANFRQWLKQHHCNTVIVPNKWIRRELPLTNEITTIAHTDGVTIYATHKETP